MSGHASPCVGTHARSPPAHPTLITLLGHLLSAVALGAAALFFALLTLRDKVHLIAVDLGDAFRHNPLVEAANQLIY